MTAEEKHEDNLRKKENAARLRAEKRLAGEFGKKPKAAHWFR